MIVLDEQLLGRNLEVETSKVSQASEGWGQVSEQWSAHSERRASLG